MARLVSEMFKIYDFRRLVPQVRITWESITSA